MKTPPEKSDRLVQLAALLKEHRNGKLDRQKLDALREDQAFAEIAHQIELLHRENQKKQQTLHYFEDRLVNSLETLLEFSNQNFEKKAYISKEGDMFDALAGAINLLGKEINRRTISRDYFNNILQSLQDMILVINTNGIIESVNHATSRQLGYSPSELPGKNLSELIEKIPQQLFQNKSGTLSTSFRQRNAEPKAVLLSWSDFKEFNNSQNNIVCIAKDISEVRAKEQLIRKQNEELKKKNAFLDTFVFTAAHDLRAPISNLQSLLELFQEEQDAFLRDQLFEGLIKSVHKLTLTVNGLVRLLDLQQHSEVNTTILYFEDIYQQVRKTLQSQIEDSQAHIHLNFKKYPRICYNADFLKNIFYNTLSNSIKFRQHGKPLNIKLSTYKQDEFIVLKIEDNGVGIDLKTSRHLLFKPFKKLTSHGSGTGIGLSMLQSIVEKNGGKIQVNSSPQKGSTFLIYLKSYIKQHQLLNHSSPQQ